MDDRKAVRRPLAQVVRDFRQSRLNQELWARAFELVEPGPRRPPGGGQPRTAEERETAGSGGPAWQKGA